MTTSATFSTSSADSRDHPALTTVTLTDICRQEEVWAYVSAVNLKGEFSPAKMQ